MASNPKPTARPDGDDEVEKSRAPLLEHLIELRKRLMWSGLAIIIGFVAVFSVAEPIYIFLVDAYQQAAEGYAERQGYAFVEAEPGAMPQPAVQDAGPVRVQLVYNAPLEAFFVQMQLALLGGIAVAFPVVAYQIYAFAAPGLYKRERGAILPFLFAMPVLFIAGAALVYYIVLPLVMGFSLRQQIQTEDISVSLLLRVSDYFKTVTTLILAFGAMFQLPVILTLLGKAGVVSSRGLRKAWRYAVVAIFVVAAIITPPDPISQSILAIPILLLYELSIWCVKLTENRRAKEEEERQAAG